MILCYPRACSSAIDSIFRSVGPVFSLPVAQRAHRTTAPLRQETVLFGNNSSPGAKSSRMNTCTKSTRNSRRMNTYAIPAFKGHLESTLAQKKGVGGGVTPESESKSRTHTQDRRVGHPANQLPGTKKVTGSQNDVRVTRPSLGVVALRQIEEQIPRPGRGLGMTG